MPGQTWTREENEAVAGAYFEMLRLEREGRDFVKRDFVRRVMERTSRGKGSVEYKFENISAVLLEKGLPFIDGYKPAKNYARALAEVVEARLAQPATASRPVASPTPGAARYVDAPPRRHGEAPTRGAGNGRGRTIDFAAQDAANRELGRAGERLVLALERERLKAAGRRDLAGAVSHAAEELGDGLGYDIASFRPDGSKLFIEVKTTEGNRSAPFYMSASEVRFAERNASAYEIHRIFQWGAEPRIYRLNPPLSDHILLEPTVFRCIVGPSVPERRTR